MAEIVKKGLLAISILLIFVGMCLTIGGAFSPAWQVVDIREFRAEHQHGLWWDCIRAEKHVVAVGDFYDEAPLHCMYKFDHSAELVIENTLNNIDEDGAAGESEHHKFWAWHKVILTLIIFSELLALISIGTGVCATCFAPTAFAFTIALFFAMLFSVIADGVFFLAANRVDNRFVTGMVGTYEQHIGYAFYLHLLGTLCWIVAFIATLATTYKFSTDDRRANSKDALYGDREWRASTIGHRDELQRQPPPPNQYGKEDDDETRNNQDFGMRASYRDDVPLDRDRDYHHRRGGPDPYRSPGGYRYRETAA